MCTNSSVLPTLPEGAEEDPHWVPSASAIISKMNRRGHEPPGSITESNLQAQVEATCDELSTHSGSSSADGSQTSSIEAPSDQTVQNFVNVDTAAAVMGTDEACPDMQETGDDEPQRRTCQEVSEPAPCVQIFSMDDDETAPEVVEPGLADLSSTVLADVCTTPSTAAFAAAAPVMPTTQQVPAALPAVASRTSSAAVGSAFGGAEKGSIMDKGPRISQASTAASTQLTDEAWTASVQARVDQEISKQIQQLSLMMDAKQQEAQREVEALQKKHEELQRQAEQLPRRRRSSTSSTTTPVRQSPTSSSTTPRQSASWAPPLAPMTPRDSEQKQSTQAGSVSPMNTKQRRHTMTQSAPRTSAASRALRRSSVGGRLELRGPDLENHRQWMMEQRQNLLEDLYPDTHAAPNARLSVATPGKVLKAAPAA